MTRLVLMGSLSALAALIGYIEFCTSEQFLESIWSELFWLLCGAILTTFVLEHVLKVDDEARRRKEDSFAFRVFVATTFINLMSIANSAGDGNRRELSEAIFDAKKFSRLASNTGSVISNSDTFSPRAYYDRYLDVAGGLRDLARSYIRVFCSNKEEMVRRFMELHELANRWDYVDEFSVRSGYEDSSHIEDETSANRPPSEKLSSAMALLKETGIYLAEISGAAAATKGVPDA